jgi:hypothetical protein
LSGNEWVFEMARLIKIRIDERLTLIVGKKVITSIPLNDLQHRQIQEDLWNQILCLIFKQKTFGEKQNELY